MECPVCGSELDHHDSFGRFCAHQDGKKVGDIWKCGACNENGNDCIYHTIGEDGELREGMPC